MAWNWLSVSESISLVELVRALNRKLRELADAINQPEPVTALTYGTTVKVAVAGAITRVLTLTVTDSTPFTIQEPSGVRAGAILIFEIINDSGGAMGTVTWDAAGYLLAGAWVNPADTKRRTITFRVGGSHLVEIARAGADI